MQSSVAWRAINRLTSRKLKPFSCLSAASTADRKRQPTNHYSAILNSQLNQQQQKYRLLCFQQWQQRNSNQESAPFTTNDIRAALRTSCHDTSPGLDDIPNRVLRIPELEGDVTDMLNRHSKALNIEKTISDKCRKSVIVSMPKRAIQLLSIISEESQKHAQAHNCSTERKMQPASGRFARSDLDRQMASTFPCPLESGPSSRFWGEPATGTRRVAGTTHTESGRR